MGISRFGLPKIPLLVGAPVVVAVGNALLCLDSNAMLYVGPITIGLANGALWTLAPQLTGTFGMKHYGETSNPFRAPYPLLRHIRFANSVANPLQIRCNSVANSSIMTRPV